MRVKRKLVFNGDVAYIPCSKEHCDHMGVSKEQPFIVLEDYVKSKGAFIAVFKDSEPEKE